MRRRRETQWADLAEPIEFPHVQHVYVSHCHDGRHFLPKLGILQRRVGVGRYLRAVRGAPRAVASNAVNFTVLFGARDEPTAEPSRVRDLSLHPSIAKLVPSLPHYHFLYFHPPSPPYLLKQPDATTAGIRDSSLHYHCWQLPEHSPARIGISQAPSRCFIGSDLTVQIPNADIFDDLCTHLANTLPKQLDGKRMKIHVNWGWQATLGTWNGAATTSQPRCLENTVPTDEGHKASGVVYKVGMMVARGHIAPEGPARLHSRGPQGRGHDVDSSLCQCREGLDTTMPTRLKGEATMALWLTCSPPTKANWVQSPVGSLAHFRMWKSCQTMLLVGEISRGSPVSPTLSFWCFSIFTSIVLIDSQDLAVKSGKNLFTHYLYVTEYIIYVYMVTPLKLSLVPRVTMALVNVPNPIPPHRSPPTSRELSHICIAQVSLAIRVCRGHCARLICFPAPRINCRAQRGRAVPRDKTWTGGGGWRLLLSPWGVRNNPYPPPFPNTRVGKEWMGVWGWKALSVSLSISLALWARRAEPCHDLALQTVHLIYPRHCHMRVTSCWGTPINSVYTVHDAQLTFSSLHHHFAEAAMAQWLRAPASQHGDLGSDPKWPIPGSPHVGILGVLPFPLPLHSSAAPPRVSLGERCLTLMGATLAQLVSGGPRRLAAHLPTAMCWYVDLDVERELPSRCVDLRALPTDWQLRNLSRKYYDILFGGHMATWQISGAYNTLFTSSNGEERSATGALRSGKALNHRHWLSLVCREPSYVSPAPCVGACHFATRVHHIGGGDTSFHILLWGTLVLMLEACSWGFPSVGNYRAVFLGLLMSQVVVQLNMCIWRRSHLEQALHTNYSESEIMTPKRRIPAKETKARLNSVVLSQLAIRTRALTL
ncbi:hypothetical protein PR048_024279 [Dryococelus australis]|uniref:Uncharacterized protein n=1 Tax=Dryococelus australis TaxID=614101 RepID=A0ABQ9GN53_9NEOP|nr:hypothetical protein PR048_024279 [Dryococelus australis]